MTNESVLTKSFTVLGVDGNHLTFSETIEHTAIVVSIQQNDERGKLATVRLNKEQFSAICGLDSVYNGLQCESTLEETPALPQPATPEQVF